MSLVALGLALDPRIIVWCAVLAVCAAGLSLVYNAERDGETGNSRRR